MVPSSRRLWLTFAIVVLALIGVAIAFNMQDRRTPAEKIGDAAGEISEGLKDAGREMQNRSPGEKLGDAVKDAGEAIKEGAQ